jgi:Protein of unknown function (DUF2569)
VSTSEVSAQANEPKGLGGWLTLVIIGLVVSPLRTAYFLVTGVAPIFTEGAWSALTTPGSPAYHALWGPLIALELMGNLGLIALAIAALILLLRRSRHAPKVAILWLSWAVLFVVTDYFLGHLIPAVAAQPDPESTTDLVRTIVGATIWIPYFLVSKRVKNTFVE